MFSDVLVILLGMTLPGLDPRGPREASWPRLADRATVRLGGAGARLEGPVAKLWEAMEKCDSAVVWLIFVIFRGVELLSWYWGNSDDFRGFDWATCSPSDAEPPGWRWRVILINFHVLYDGFIHLHHLSGFRSGIWI